MAMTPTEIEEERRRGRYAGAAAIAAGLLFPAGLIWSQIVSRDTPENNAPAELRFFDRHAESLLASAALRSLALVLLVVVTLYLYRATKARNPGLNPIVAVVGVAGPLLLAAGGVAHDVYLAVVAADFAGRDVQSIKAAEDLTNGPLPTLTFGLIWAGTLGLAFWFVIGSLNAMRTGLLSRFMGVLGVIIGPAFVLGLAPLLITFWLGAVGALLLGFWPRGRPPAWDAGEAIPWPSARERESDRADHPVGSSDGELNAGDPAMPEQGTDGADGAGADGAGAKRKRKRRGRR